MAIEHNINEQQFSLENDAEMIIINGEAFTYKNSGLTRRVFVNKDKTKVIKVPVQKDMFNFNEEELKCWEEASDEVKAQMAVTKMLENGYIEQEFLHTLDDPETEKWLGRPMTMEEIRFAKSCRSDVGYDKDRNLKCFDLHEFKQY